MVKPVNYVIAIREQVIVEVQDHQLAKAVLESKRGHIMQRQFNSKRFDEIDTIYQSALDEINLVLTSYSQQENERLKKAILAIEYPCSLNNVLFYINEEVANMLAASTRPLLKEWGIKCLNFYKQSALNIHVEPKTGVVVAKRGGISAKPNGLFSGFEGQGVWDTSKARWVPSSNSKGHLQIFKDALDKGCPSHGIHRTTPINPPDFSKYPEFPIELISPMHIAALIGDDELMQQLMLKGAGVNDSHNKWQVTPLELAIINEHENVIDFILQHEVSTHTALKLAAEKGSFRIIKKIVAMNAPITDEVLNVALKRDRKLHTYLNRCRKKDIEYRLEHHKGDVFKALNEVLNYPVIPIQSLIGLIQKDPRIILNIQNEDDGNTLLHQLVIGKEVAKVKALLQAIEQIHHNNVEFIFDREKKNKSGKTILDLALELALKESKEGKDLVECILMINPKISEPQQKPIMSKIDINEIRRGKEDKINNTLANQNQEMNVQKKVLKNTNRSLIEARKEIEYLKETITKQNHIMKIHQQELNSTKQMLNKTLEEVADLKNITAQQSQALKVQQDVLEVTIQELISVTEQAKQLDNQIQDQQIIFMQIMHASNNESMIMDRELVFSPPQETISDEIYLEKITRESVNLKPQRKNQLSLPSIARNTYGIFTYNQNVIGINEDEENVSKLEMK